MTIMIPKKNELYARIVQNPYGNEETYRTYNMMKMEAGEKILPLIERIGGSTTNIKPPKLKSLYIYIYIFPSPLRL